MTIMIYDATTINCHHRWSAGGAVGAGASLEFSNPDSNGFSFQLQRKDFEFLL